MSQAGIFLSLHYVSPIRNNVVVTKKKVEVCLQNMNRRSHCFERALLGFQSSIHPRGVGFRLCKSMF